MMTMISVQCISLWITEWTNCTKLHWMIWTLIQWLTSSHGALGVAGDSDVSGWTSTATIVTQSTSLTVNWPSTTYLVDVPWWKKRLNVKQLNININTIALLNSSGLRDVTCHMGSHSVICHPTQANAPRLNPSLTAWYSIYLPRIDRRLSWPRWLDTYRDSLPVSRQSPIQVVTVPSVM